VSMETAMLDESRIHTICDAIRQADARGLPGALAEFGTYRGGTARRMSETSPRRRLFVFDTFEGLSEPDRAHDGADYVGGQWKASLVEAAPQFLGLPATIVTGEFPESAVGIDPVFVVAHLDMNLYQPTLAARHYVWDRMVLGGSIFLDDYRYASTPGIARAVHEFGRLFHVGSNHQAMIERT
jgi:O-methyltransferase